MYRATCSRLILALVMLASLFFSSNAFAQDETARVVVLKFETFDVSDAVMETFYSSLDASIDAHPNKVMTEGGQVTIGEMMVTLGCESPTPECLSQLADLIEGDQILFGSVQRSENIHLFTIRIFDLRTGAFESQVEDQTVEGDEATVTQAIPALIDSLLYGDVGTLNVNINGAEDAEVYFDGKKVGKAPTGLKDLPLGEHVVTLRTPDGREETKKVILKRGEPSTLVFNFEEVTDPGDATPPNLARVGGVASIGVGVLALALGTQQRLKLRGLEQQASNEAVFNDGQISDDEADKAANLIEFYQPQMQTAHRNSLIGFGAGAALVGLGAALVVMSKGEEAPAEASNRKLRNLRLDLAPTRQGAAAGLTFQF
jgi:hypothetical protein